MAGMEPRPRSSEAYRSEVVVVNGSNVVVPSLSSKDQTNKLHLVTEEQTTQNVKSMVMTVPNSSTCSSISSVDSSGVRVLNTEAIEIPCDVNSFKKPKTCTPIIVKIGDDNSTVQGTDVDLTRMLNEISEGNETLYNFILKKKPFHRHLVERNMHISKWYAVWQIIYHSGTRRGRDFVASATLYLLGKEYVMSLWCVHCNSMFEGNPKDFEIHMAEMHESELVLLPCDFCGEFVRLMEYTAHWSRHFFQHCCDVCDKHFQSKSRLQRHRSAHKVQPYSCQYCNVKMNNKWNIRKHERQHFEERKSTPQELCHICGKMYNCARIIHMNTHNEGRTFPCQVCGSMYKSQYILNCHYRRKHTVREDKETKFKMCDQCGKKLKACALQKHMRRHKKDFSYECAACGKKFYEETALRKHTLAHSDERNFDCGVCGKAFKSNKYLKSHSMIHSEEKNFTCPLCGKKIRMASNYYTHLKVHRKRGEVVPSKEEL